jgi:ABC-2 type transport system ATP-binding protein
MAAIKAVDLSKQYGTQTALNKLNLTVDTGEIFCLLGQNGAGKTTTINLFLGFLEASDGIALVNNVEVAGNRDALRKYVAYIPEVVQLYGQLTGAENLDFFCRLAGYKYAPEKLENYLNMVGLPAQAHLQRLSGYSKGMRQKVGIAIALAKDAKVIFMDEPTSGLDPKATSEFTEICKTLVSKGITIFMATHDIFNAVATGTRIGIMKEGSLVYEVKVSDVSAASLQQLYLETV